jgi:glycosyltransferase involved in cell wall biosynthesis
MAAPLESCAVDLHGLVALKNTVRPLRVLFVIPDAPARASMVFVRKQISSLEQLGMCCSSFLLSSRTSLKAVLAERRRLQEQIGIFQPDIIHVQYGTVTALFSVLATQLPIIVTFRGGDLNPSPTMRCRSATGQFLSQLAALRARRIICVSHQLKSRLWWRKGRVSVIPSGVDTDVFRPRPKADCREQLHWDESARVVLFNGGVDPASKRLDLAQQAVNAAQSSCGRIQFEVLDGNVDPALIPIMMNAADCLVLTSKWEGSPNVVKEAMACNLPVVSVDVGDVRERLSGVHPSAIVSRNPLEIGEAIADMVTTGKRSNGRQFIDSFRSEVISQQVIAVYRAALEMV